MVGKNTKNRVAWELNGAELHKLVLQAHSSTLLFWPAPGNGIDCPIQDPARAAKAGMHCLEVTSMDFPKMFVSGMKLINVVVIITNAKYRINLKYLCVCSIIDH